MQVDSLIEGTKKGIYGYIDTQMLHSFLKFKSYNIHIHLFDIFPSIKGGGATHMC